jgi:hypothetical protein
VHLTIKGADDLGNGKLQLEFLGLEARGHVIQPSSNLVDWVRVGTCTAGGAGNVQFINPVDGKHSVRFYRIVQPGTP